MRKTHSFIVFSLIIVFSTCCLAVNQTFVNPMQTKFKILGVFGHPGKSHFDVFKPLLEELARRGHELTVISYFPRTDNAKINHGWFRPMLDLHMLRFMADYACSTGLRSSSVKKFLQSDEKFDLILTENFNTDCFLGFIHRFKAPYMALSSHQIMPWTNSDMANTDNPSYIPVILLGLTKPLDFFSRIKNALWLLLSKAIYEYYFRSVDQVVANEVFGTDLPKLKEIALQSQALLVNTHSSIHGSRPQLPNVIEIGGLHIPSRVNPLPKDVAEFLDSAHEGVLYFNLGSMIKMSSIPQEKLNAILKVIGSIPRKVIWKWEADKLPRKLDNVMARKWLPQFDIMNHRNVKCYLGHGGLLGLSESVYVGLPMILVPMYGDQFHNSAAAETRGTAVVLAYDNLTEETLRSALDKVFNDTSYHENAQRLSKAYRDRPATPMETAIWWTEYIARGNGRFYFRSDSTGLSWYQRHLVDITLVLIIVSIIFIYILFRLVKLLLLLLRFFKRTSRNQVEEKRKLKKDN
ncbi:PREDICTED: UDP-glucuronosyltransferase 2A3-like isoform X2 [Trachymyrmex septentrionalis]|uniref:UDP-glucuronosyltransferase 2A3-like isoform X2 n=1 Tax=Trachymyrmex septentrionalis TaxID=34720 RepID=UPI00084ED207|nr:PREDICTED: UDP-glucuronosyltransferase 2A3-like isoform X2 [Trachymyrmex septentrionalis]